MTCSYLEATKNNNNHHGGLYHSEEEITIIQLLTDAARLLFALDVHKVIIVSGSSSIPVLLYEDLLARVAFIAFTTRCDVSSSNSYGYIKDDFNHIVYQCQVAMLQLLMDGSSELMERLIELDEGSMVSSGSDYDEKTRAIESSMTIGSEEEHHQYKDRSSIMGCSLVPALVGILDRLLLLLMTDDRTYSSSSRNSSRRDDKCSSIAPILVRSYMMA